VLKLCLVFISDTTIFRLFNILCSVSLTLFGVPDLCCRVYGNLDGTTIIEW
jgi:hypothetical protein